MLNTGYLSNFEFEKLLVDLKFQKFKVSLIDKFENQM